MKAFTAFLPANGNHYYTHTITGLFSLHTEAFSIYSEKNPTKVMDLVPCLETYWVYVVS